MRDSSLFFLFYGIISKYIKIYIIEFVNGDFVVIEFFSIFFFFAKVNTDLSDSDSVFLCLGLCRDLMGTV